MKFTNKTFIPDKPAILRANQAWAVDFQILDLPHRPVVMLVIDVGTRLPLSATVTLTIAEDVVATLERLVRRSKGPKEIWTDNGFRLLETWAARNGIAVTYYKPKPKMRALTEPLFHDLGSYLGDKLFSSFMELGHDIERWRHGHVAARLLRQSANH